MRWSREALRGTMKVFRFSLSQQLKSRANIITFVILFLLAAGAIPFMALTSGKGSVSASDIQAVYVENETGYELDFGEAAQLDETFRETAFETADFGTEDYQDRLEKDQVFVRMEEGTAGYGIDLYTREDSSLDQEDLSPLEKVLQTMFENARLRAAGASAGELEQLGTARVEVVSAEEFLNPQETDWETGFTVQYAYAIVVLMLCLFSSAYVVRAIAEEKSSRLVELLMVSVRPLALLLGKVLAMMSYILLLLAVLLLGAGVSYGVTGRFLDVSGISLTGMLGAGAESLRLGPGLAAVAVISLLLGYLTFSLLAGLAGCCCDSMDDVEGANMKVVLAVMAGYLVSCIAGTMSGTGISLFVSLFPLVSIFCAPVQFALGNIGLGILILSWLIQVLVIGGMAVFSARVYNDLIIFRGSRVGFGKLLAMAGKKGGRKE